MKIKVKNPVFGVPITFLDKHCPAQFDIVSFRKGEDGSEKIFYQEDENQINSTIIGGGGNIIINGLMNNPKDTEVNGKSTYARILIRQRWNR